MRRSDGCICPRGVVEHIPECHPIPFGGNLVEDDIARALDWAIHLAVGHLLSHPTDEHQLSLAIELLKTIRDEPDRIPLMFERWELEPDAARDARLAVEARFDPSDGIVAS